VVDKTFNVHQLRIEPEQRASSRPRFWISVVGAAILIIAALGGVALFAANTDAPVAVRSIVVPGYSHPGTAGETILDASGFIIAQRQATVSAKISGKVIDFPVLIGARVKQGDIIARLDDTNARAAVGLAAAQVDQAEATLQAARLALDDATPIYQRNEVAFGKGLVSEEMLQSAKATYDAAQSKYEIAVVGLRVAQATLGVAQQQQIDTTIRAPFSGIVIAKAAQVGEIVSPVSAGTGFTRTGLATIVDMDSLEVIVDVNESFLNRIKVGQAASIKLSAYPDLTLTGKVSVIVPEVNRATATVNVYVGFTDHDTRVLPNMSAKVSFLDNDTVPVAAAENGVLVPADAVKANGDAGIVYRIQGDHLEQQIVRLGPGTANKRRIVSGVSPGDRLAVGDFSQLKDGSVVTVKE
jgi:RND family efflux transporter MFP subunit